VKVTDTTCPNCSAPATPGAQACGRCGYEFLEGGHGQAPRPGALWALGGAAAVTGAVILVALLIGGGDGGGRAPAAAGIDTSRRLEVLSERPLPTGAAERRLEARFAAMRDEDSAAVHCSRREAKPAHSVRRCSVRYLSGIERSVVLLTNARGNEVISEP
jgi:hypothetical protein